MAVGRWLKTIICCGAGFFIPAAAFGQGPLETKALVDLTARNTSAKNYSNLTFHGGSNFDPLRIRLFLEKKVSDRVEVFTQFLSNDANAPFVYGAYVRIKSKSTWVTIETGLIRTPFGAWGERTYSDRNPLIGIPLGYNYHTALLMEDYSLQKSPYELLSHRGLGLGNPAYSNSVSAGLPLVYDNCWNSGILAFGGNGKFEYMAGLLAGSLSKPSVELERSRPQLTSRLGFTPILGLTTGSSFAYGPYLTNESKTDLPPGTSVDNFYQRLFGWDLKFERGKFVGHAEALHNRWTHPYIADPLDVYSAYVEAAYKFATQFFLAARYDRMEFSKISDGWGGETVWDFPLYRVETGLGYRFDRNVTFKLVSQLTRYPGRHSLNDDIFAVQMSTRF